MLLCMYVGYEVDLIVSHLIKIQEEEVFRAIITFHFPTSFFVLCLISHIFVH